MANRTNLHGKAQALMGDRTSHGGAILSGSPTSRWHGIPIARKGDRTFCPRCKPYFFEIAEGLDSCTDTVDRTSMATEGHRTTCGATLIATTASTEILTAIGLWSNNSGYDDRYVLRDAHGVGMPLVHYAAEITGFPIQFGITDEQGHTHLHLSGAAAREISIYIAG